MTPLEFFKSEKAQLETVARASRAPSVHNTQAARWKFSNQNKISLYADPSARLNVADKSGVDHLVGLGAAFETMQIVLSERSLVMLKVRMSPPGELLNGHEKILEAEISEKIGMPDLLAPFVSQRNSFRGVFEKASQKQLQTLNKEISFFERAQIVSELSEVENILNLADEASFEFMKDENYLKELYSWMRFSRLHPRWNVDGLNADVMALNFFERSFAAGILQPQIFKSISGLSFTQNILDEAPKHTATSICLLITKPTEEKAFDTGRQFARLWLHITKAGFAVCPMSALADSPRTRDILTERFRIPKEKSLMTVLRAGIVPEGQQKISPRISAKKLIL